MRVYNIDELTKEKFCRNLNYKYQLIFKLGCKTGLRISDIVKLEKTVLEKRQPTVIEQKTKKSKRIYIPKKLKAELVDFCQNNTRYIFESPAKDGHITRQAVWKHFKTVAKRLNIKINIGTHTMRKNHAQNLHLSGKSYNYIKNKLNHNNLSDTLLYLLEE